MRNQEGIDNWEDEHNKLETKITTVSSPGVLAVRRTYCVNSAPVCVHKEWTNFAGEHFISMSFCNASAELRCTCTWRDSGLVLSQHSSTCYFYWCRNCAVWGETAVVDTDKHYVVYRTDSLTGFYVGCNMLVLRHERLSFCLINIHFCILHHAVFRQYAVYLHHSAVF